MAALNDRLKKTKTRADITAEETTCGGNESWEARIAQLLMKVETSIDTGKASVSDFIRLMEKHRECEGEVETQITVRWVDPTEAR